MPPDKKYQSDGGPGPGRIARLFSLLPNAEDRAHNRERFFDALVFNYAMLGTDAHAKNYSLMLDGDSARLAPLYDLGSHAPYPTRGGVPMRLAMSIGGEYRAAAIDSAMLVDTGVKLGLVTDHARDRVADITEHIVQAYDVAAEQARRALGDEPFIGTLQSSIAAYAEDRGWYSPTRITDIGR